MQRCTYCGNEQPDEAIACPVDGQPLKLVIISQPPVITPQPPAKEQEPAPWNPIGKVRRTYLVFVVVGLFGLPLTLLSPEDGGLRYGDIGFSLFNICCFAFLAVFAAALRCGLDYSWGRTAKSLLIIIFLPVVLIILGDFILTPLVLATRHRLPALRIPILIVGYFLPPASFLIPFAILDRRVCLASRQVPSVPTHASRLAGPSQGFPYRLMLMEVALLFLVSAFTSATLPAFLTQFEGIDIRLPSITAFWLIGSLGGTSSCICSCLLCFGSQPLYIAGRQIETTGRHRSCHFLFGLCGGLLLYDRHDDVRNYEQHRAMRIPSRRPGRGTGGIPSPHPLVA
jgi:hypothetical protein